MTIQARSRLIGQLRSFVEFELCGLIAWDQVALSAGEKTDDLPDGRRNPLGPHREIAEIAFLKYEISIQSSADTPPLGCISLRYSGKVDQGPIDQRTWTRLAKVIREAEYGIER